MDPTTSIKLQSHGAVSSPGLISQLSLGDLPLHDISFLASSWEYYYPLFSNDSNNPVDITISPSNLYTDLGNIWMFVSGKITKKDGTTFAASQCAPATNFLSSLWSNFELSIGNVPLTKNSNFYPYVSYMTKALCENQSTKNGRLKLELWSNEADDSKTSVGYAYRKTISANSKTFCVLGKPCHGLFQSNKYLVPNVSLRLTFRRSVDEFNIDHETLVPADPADKVVYDASFKLETCHLLVRRVAVGAQVQQAHESMLARNIPLRYPYFDSQIISYVLPSGTMSNVSESLSVGPLPARVVVGFVESDAFFGDYTKNAFNFKPQDIEQCSLLVNGEPIIFKSMEFDFTKRDYLTAFVQSLQMAKDGHDISPDKFASSHFMLCYDILPTAKENSFASNREGVLRFQTKFKKDLPSNINVVVLLIYQSILNLTKNGATVQLV